MRLPWVQKRITDRRTKYPVRDKFRMTAIDLFSKTNHFRQKLPVNFVNCRIFSLHLHTPEYVRTAHWSYYRCTSRKMITEKILSILIVKKKCLCLFAFKALAVLIVDVFFYIQE